MTPKEDRRSESESLALLHQKVDYLVDSHNEIKVELYSKNGIKDTTYRNEWEIKDINSHRNRLYVFASSAGLLAIGALIKSFLKGH